MSMLARLAASGQRAGGVKTILGAMAIAWGTKTISSHAAEATERAHEAAQVYESLQDQITQAGIEREAIRDEASDMLSAAVKAGRCDDAVRARYAAIELNQIAPEDDAPAVPGAPNPSGGENIASLRERVAGRKGKEL